MRNSLDALLPRIRQEILAATLLRPERWWFMADLARHLGVRPSSLQRELPALVATGILRQRKEGRQVYYQADPACPVLPDLQGLLRKTVGLRDVMQQALAPLQDSIDAAFIHGSVARGDHAPGSDVDLMIVGKLSLEDVSGALEGIETRLGRDVHPTVYSPSEFARRAGAGEHFLKEVLASPRLLVAGSADALERLAGPPARAPARSVARRARRAPPSRRS